MTDKELLELAAKAAGIEIVGLVDEMICQPDHRTCGFIIRNDRGGDSCWNPLTDDGDAMRLAVKLGLTVCISFKYGLTWADKDDKGHALAKSNHDGDTYAATRRAIVLAAAEIGKTL